MTEYTLTFNEQDMQVLTAAIGELPFKIAAPFVQKINEQIAKQQGPVNGTGAPLEPAERTVQ